MASLLSPKPLSLDSRYWLFSLLYFFLFLRPLPCFVLPPIPSASIFPFPCPPIIVSGLILLALLPGLFLTQPVLVLAGQIRGGVIPLL